MFSEFVAQNLIWVAAFVILFNLLLFSFVQGNIRGASMVSALELPQLQRDGKSVIIDVNDEKEFATAHIPDASNFPLSSINEQNSALLKHKDKRQNLPVRHMDGKYLLCQSTGNIVRSRI